MNNVRKSLAATAVAAALLATSPLIANAQGGFLHRHSGMAGIGAAMAAHHAAKVGGRNRMASGRRPNLAERHPMVSAVGAGVVTHHLLHKH